MSMKLYLYLKSSFSYYLSKINVLSKKSLKLKLYHENAKCVKMNTFVKSQALYPVTCKGNFLENPFQTMLA